MNKITLQAYTQGIESTYESEYGQDMDKVALDRIFDDPVVHYSAFDYLGIDLHDKDLVYADETDNIGFVSSTIYDGTTEEFAYVQIDFAANYNFDRGLMIHFHDDWSALKTVRVKFYTESRTDKWATAPEPAIEANLPRTSWLSTTAFEMINNYLEHYGETLTSIRLYPGIDESQILGEYTNINGFMKIDGITFGFEGESADIQGDISVYTEISESKTDTPAGTCDVVATFKPVNVVPISVDEYINIEPEEGMNFILETDNIKGKYTITSVTRQGENIYNIQATDDIENTGTFVLNNTEEHLTYTNPKMFTKGITTSWNDKTLDDISVKGWVNAGETNRQALAHFSAASNRWITAFNDPVGIHTITERRTNKIITADRILGNAEFKRNYNYKGVEISQELNGIVYVTQVASKAAQNNNKGWFKLDNFGMRPTADALKNMVIMANNILRFLNGNEVIATIVYDGEQLGDIVTIETPYNGNITGLIKSLDFTIGINSTIATVTIKEVVE